MPNCLVGKANGSRVDGWEMVGFLQYGSDGRALFLHRTANKWHLQRPSWEAQLLSGPMPEW